jgi:hypothetical protein
MTVPDFEITDDPGTVWHVGFAPDAWAWVPWRYANDSGLFDGRWDDPLGQVRTSTPLILCWGACSNCSPASVPVLRCSQG